MKRHPMRLILLLALLSALLLIVTSVGAAPAEDPAAKEGLAVSLTAAKSHYKATEDVTVTVTITNLSGHSARVLRWFTPAEGLEEPVFALKVNGKPADYTGAVYKRPAPTGSDYITLKSG